MKTRATAALPALAAALALAGCGSSIADSSSSTPASDAPAVQSPDTDADAIRTAFDNARSGPEGAWDELTIGCRAIMSMMLGGKDGLADAFAQDPPGPVTVTDVYVAGDTAALAYVDEEGPHTDLWVRTGDGWKSDCGPDAPDLPIRPGTKASTEPAPSATAKSSMPENVPAAQPAPVATKHMPPPANAEPAQDLAPPAPAAVEQSVTTADSAPPVGFTGAPRGEPQPLTGKTIDYCMDDPTMYQPGTTMFTDGTTGWTQDCAS
ncbi:MULTISPECIES: nuclear transport factor 2 family protein [Tomitella]|uniref:Uncharacterized protein n=1 Tax=Tomitella cavernea TaxID=1387982 RepID=A0ABP9CG58_9ACTN|nr:MULTISPECIES: nuclear transport factor 2 family protein [Tomitella]